MDKNDGRVMSNFIIQALKGEGSKQKMDFSGIKKYYYRDNRN